MRGEIAERVAIGASLCPKGLRVEISDRIELGGGGGGI